MAGTDHPVQISPRERTRLTGGGGFVAGGLILAVVAFAVALLIGRAGADGVRRVYFAYLLNFCYFLSLSLGALFFVLVQHTARAGWSVAVRRVAEVQATAVVFLLIGLLPIFATLLSGNGLLYRWAAPIDITPEASHEGEHGSPLPGENGHAENASSGSHGGPAGLAEDPLHIAAAPLPRGGIDHHVEEIYVAKKRAFLNVPFFMARCLLYFAIWGGLAWWLWRRSTQQDESGDARLTRAMQRVSPAGIVVFGLTLTFAAFDLLMSLSPAWYSTIFGGYYFSGSFVGGLALLILTLMGLQRAGYLTDSVTTDHYHDLGKFLFGFVFFWGYIAFSQYMLIWYASLPETVYWFAARGATTVPEQMNPWSYVIVALLFGHFIIPFLGLLSRHVKRNRFGLAFWSIWLLVFHWIDIWWLTMPEMGPRIRFGLPEVLTFVAVGGLFAAGWIWTATRHALIPLRDPRLGDSLAFEDV
ncbi:MAG: quinol:cytochrome C oxidoreductase [Phycisphaerae bacterium]|nr:quinol:cytochrome C oxidoreductase [Phycisphaerae bacterium]